MTSVFFDETWFYAPVEEGAAEAELPEAEAHHAARVLRLRPGAEIVVSNGNGMVFRAALRDERGGLEVLGVLQQDPLPPGWSVGLPLLKGRDTEIPAEAACEFDVHNLYLLRMDYSTWSPGRDDSRLLERLRQKSVTALKQAKKSWLTRVHAPQELREWRAAHGEIPLIVAHPDGDTVPSPLPPELHLLTGPEGGFSEAEIEYLFAQEHAWRLNLGPTRLRAVHAPVAALGSLTGRTRF